MGAFIFIKSDWLYGLDLKSGWNEIILEKLAAKLDSASLAGLLPDNLKQKSVIFQTGVKNLMANNALLNLSKLDQMDLIYFAEAITGQYQVKGAKQENLYWPMICICRLISLVPGYKYTR